MGDGRKMKLFAMDGTSDKDKTKRPHGFVFHLGEINVLLNYTYCMCILYAGHIGGLSASLLRSMNIPPPRVLCSCHSLRFFTTTLSEPADGEDGGGGGREGGMGPNTWEGREIEG